MPDRGERLSDCFASNLFNFRRQPNTGGKILSFDPVDHQILGKITQSAPQLDRFGHTEGVRRATKPTLRERLRARSAVSIPMYGQPALPAMIDSRRQRDQVSMAALRAIL
jgi:hypothetical protein